MKNILLLLSFIFLMTIPCSFLIAYAQTVQTDQATHTPQIQPTEIPLPEIPPTPRSKLEIIQYILLPFAIGASIWLILRLDKIEREVEKKEDLE
ncbi:MAG: hypothetical protein MRJ65_05485 [Candidatus Brocadiaceae bacterium]|nr:hypothetical protein [Candidatus Brocadiaceae bacterium]